MAREWGARAIVLCADVFRSPAELKGHLAADPNARTILVARDVSPFQDMTSDSVEVIQAPDVGLARMEQIKMAILLGISRRVLSHGDRVVCVSGVAGSDQIDTLLLTEVGEEPEMFATADIEELRQHSNPEVFEKVLDIAIDLGHEGREGKPVGALFVVGDVEHVKGFCDPLILNPLQGHPEEQRNVLNPAVRETIKELSALDGAFLVRDDGVVESAGVFLRCITPGSALPPGLGALHRTAAGITAATKATAVAVSESTGTVRVFRDGKIVIEIERPRAVGSSAPVPGTSS
jgi:DNA integrity scanning protein DisA with diadenylate cyclase activity